jgi:hypothetical protein
MDYQNLEKRVSKLTVRDTQDKKVKIKSLWDDRRIVLTFLRHFG